MAPFEPSKLTSTVSLPAQLVTVPRVMVKIAKIIRAGNKSWNRICGHLSLTLTKGHDVLMRDENGHRKAVPDAASHAVDDVVRFLLFCQAELREPDDFSPGSLFLRIHTSAKTEP